MKDTERIARALRMTEKQFLFPLRYASSTNLLLENATMNKIFVFINLTVSQNERVISYESLALAEDGYFVGAGFHSSVEWLKHDMGVTSTQKHDQYQEHYPEGFIVEYVEPDENESTLYHSELRAAYEKHDLLCKTYGDPRDEPI